MTNYLEDMCQIRFSLPVSRILVTRIFKMAEIAPVSAGRLISRFFLPQSPDFRCFEVERSDHCMLSTRSYNSLCKFNHLRAQVQALATELG